MKQFKKTSGKIIMVTGASSGIGKEAVLQLAQQGHYVVMVCRNTRRGEPALTEIKSRSGSDRIELLTADLASQRQIRTLVDRFKATFDRLDVLVNNAGLFLAKRSETEDHIEMTWAVNHLAPFLLTNLLLDTLKTSAPTRVVTISSDVHRGVHLDFDDLEMRHRYNWIRAYQQSKLANVLFTYELARRLKGTGVTANCMHPGGVATKIWNRNNNLVSLIMRPLKAFMMSPEKSAKSVVRLATSPEVEGNTGTYFVKSKMVRSSEVSYDEAVAGRLWSESAKMVRLA